MSSDCSKMYWRSYKEANGVVDDPEAGKTDVALWLEDSPPGNIDRRGFLKAAGFGAAAVTVAGCSQAPVQKAIPFLNQPVEMVPGRALHYATACGACPAGCGAVVKVRDGRPIKLEGNPEHPASAAGLCAIGQASLLGLYDSHRFKTPQSGGAETTWEEVDRVVTTRLAEVKQQGGAVRILTGAVNSPTLLATIPRFLSSYPNSKHVMYDPLSSSAILDAHERTHGVRMLPRYRFDKAAVIVSFDADFLGTWISPVTHAVAYRSGRKLEATTATMSYHVQFESCMSLTGSKADQRFRIAPAELGAVLSQATSRVANSLGVSFDSAGVGAVSVSDDVLNNLAKRLIEAKGNSLIVCGSQDIEAQVVCNALNAMLGNYGATVDLDQRSYQRQGSDRDMATLLQELQQGAVAAIIVAGVNPVYELPDGAAIGEAIRKAGLSIAIAERSDETTQVVQHVCPSPHFLESWGDVEALDGIVTIRQPLMHPLFKTRSVIESLNVWMGDQRDVYATIQSHWQDAIHPRSSSTGDFRSFWDRTLHDGFAQVQTTPIQIAAFDGAGAKAVSGEATASDMTLVLYPKVGMADGRHAYNPWLQELPDPISKATWDNYACLSVATAKEKEIEEGDVVRVEVSGPDGSTRSIELPAYVQPGQHDKVVSIALGYGQSTTARFADVGPDWILHHPSVGDDGLVGKNAAPLLALDGGTLRYVRTGAKLTKTGARRPLACTQTYHTITVPKNLAPANGLVRPVIQETTLAAYAKDPASGKEHIHEVEGDLYPAEDHPYRGRRWAMAIDLTACSGCSACAIACQAENNVPVVGRDEVQRRREMHWMRIDRYYSGEGDEIDVAHQPMLCQHCENASCENVCPVLATVHTAEGLNAQVYNRCVGTRYCANNCAYKVRRFNWFTYRHDDPVENLVLNPDVSVRTRGIMEKCSFCVQRIQEAKIEAKRRGEPLADGAIKPACQQSCPMQAIVFGDINDPNSAVSAAARHPRQYRVLEEINVRPSVHYLTLVRNRTEEEGNVHHV